MDAMDEILRDAPRLSRKDAFEFGCHAGLPCFNQCCRDLTIELTPADIISIRKALGLSASEFLKEYAQVHMDHARGLPAAYLKMRDDEQATCPFVQAAGCQVYGARPTACRLYPVGRALLAGEKDRPGQEFFFLLEEDPCVGYAEKKHWTIQEWLDDQGVSDCDHADLRFVELCQHPALQEMKRQGRSFKPAQLNEYFMAMYNTDRFCDYLEAQKYSAWLALDEQERQELASDGHKLMQFAVTWLEQRLFGG